MSATPSPELTAHRPPLHALTGIRFVAASYIIVYHTQFALAARARNAGAFDHIIDNGYLAVTLFFILSGFILAYTYRGRVLGRGAYRRFWEARFARIWPMYAVSLAFASLVHRSIPQPAIAIPTLFMMQAWNPFNLAMASAWNPVCWTLSVEALFYLLFPLVQTWIERRAVRMLPVLLAATVALCVACNVSWRTLNYAPIEGAYRYVPYALVHVPEFVTGVMLGNLFLRRAHFRFQRPVVGGWAWLAAAFSLGVLSLHIVSLTSLAVPAFGALVFSLAAEPSLLQRLLSIRWFVLGGEISYSMYLLHLPLKDLCNPLFDHAHLSVPALRFAAEFVAVVLISWVAFHAIEDPSRRGLRKVFLHIEKRT